MINSPSGCLKALYPLQTRPIPTNASKAKASAKPLGIENYQRSFKPECFFQITTDFDRAGFFFVPHFQTRPPAKGVPSAPAGGRF